MTVPRASSSRRHILVVEDEPSISRVIRQYLCLAGFDVTEVGEGHRALELGTARRFDLIILDLMLPGLDGLTLCRALRAESANRDTGIVMLTGKDAESDRVLGLESGADDYVTKPFGIRELVARVGAVLRRAGGAVRHGDAISVRHLRSRDVALDADRREVLVRGRSVELTRQEFDLLHLLMSRPHEVFSRGTLITHVWNAGTDATERTVDCVVSRLRRKVEQDPHTPALVVTAWGVGYKFADAE